MSEYLLTIGIPTFNREKDLQDTLVNILPQVDLINQRRGNPVQVVVCDNCSTDGTAQMAKSYLEHHPFLKYHCNEKNIGMMRNIHKVGSQSDGEYFLPMGDDDFLYPTCLGRLLDFLEKHKNENLSYVSLGYEDLPVSNDGLTTHRKRSLDSGIYDPSAPITGCFPATELLFISASVFRTATFIDTKQFDNAEPSELATHLQIIYELAGNSRHGHFKMPVVIGSRVSPNKWGGMWAVMIGYEFAKLASGLKQRGAPSHVVDKVFSLREYLRSYIRLSLLREDYGIFYQRAKQITLSGFRMTLGRSLVDLILDRSILRSWAYQRASVKDPLFQEKKTRIHNYLTRLEPTK